MADVRRLSSIVWRGDGGMGERIDSFKELRVYKEAWALNLEVLLLTIICVNL